MKAELVLSEVDTLLHHNIAEVVVDTVEVEVVAKYVEAVDTVAEVVEGNTIGSLGNYTCLLSQLSSLFHLSNREHASISN